MGDRIAGVKGDSVEIHHLSKLAPLICVRIIKYVEVRVAPATHQNGHLCGQQQSVANSNKHRIRRSMKFSKRSYLTSAKNKIY